MAATAFPLPGPTLFSHAPPQLPGLPGPTGGLSATPLPPSSPFPIGVRDNSRNLGPKTNGHVAYVVDVSLDDVGGYQGGRNELMFAENGNTRGRRLYGSRFRSLSALNFHLRTKVCKKAYGRLKHAVGGEAFLAHWSLYGVQKTDIPVYDRPDLAFSRRSALPFYVGKEAMTWNYWLATAGRNGINQGDHLWLLARRYREPQPFGSVPGGPSKKQRLALKMVHELPAPKAPSSDPEEKIDAQEMKSGDEDAETKRKAAASLMELEFYASEAVAEADVEGEYFWQLVPWSSPSHEPPSVQLYTGPDWVGSAIYVGLAGMRYESEGSWPGTEKSVAHAATFPEGSNYRDAMREGLPRVLVFLRSGRMPGC